MADFLAPTFGPDADYILASGCRPVLLVRALRILNDICGDERIGRLGRDIFVSEEDDANFVDIDWSVQCAGEPRPRWLAFTLSIADDKPAEFTYRDIRTEEIRRLKFSQEDEDERRIPEEMVAALLQDYRAGPPDEYPVADFLEPPEYGWTEESYRVREALREFNKGLRGLDDEHNL